MICKNKYFCLCLCICLTYLSALLFALLSRSGSRIAGPSGGVKRRWTTAPWSSMIPPCCPSIAPLCPPTWGQWPTQCPWIPGSPLPSPVPHPCTPFQGSWARHRACSRPTRATDSSILHLEWSKVCSPWPRPPTSVHPASMTNTRWRMRGVPASRHSGWKPKSTFNRWIKRGNTCDLTRPLGLIFKLLPWMFTNWISIVSVERTHSTKGVRMSDCFCDTNEQLWKLKVWFFLNSTVKCN